MEINLKGKVVRKSAGNVWELLPFYAEKDGQKRDIYAIYQQKGKKFCVYESGKNQFSSLTFLAEQGYKFYAEYKDIKFEYQAIEWENSWKETAKEAKHD